MVPPRVKPYLWAAFVGGPIAGALLGLLAGHLTGSVLVGFVVAALGGWGAAESVMRLYRHREYLYRQLWFQPFDCQACGEHIIDRDRPHMPPVCARCLEMPGWWLQPHIVDLIDGRQRRERS